MKTVYLFDEATGEYLQPYDAHPNPLEPGKFIEPKFSTSDVPPEEPINKKAVRVDGAWVLVDDFRGETWYAGYGKAVEITELGTPAGLTANEPEATASDFTQKDLIDHAEQKAARLEASLANPLDNLRRTKAAKLQGRRARGQATQADTDWLAAVDADPRVDAAISLLDAADAIIADIKSGLITTTAGVEADARWP